MTSRKKRAPIRNLQDLIDFFNSNPFSAFNKKMLVGLVEPIGVNIKDLLEKAIGFGYIKSKFEKTAAYHPITMYHCCGYTEPKLSLNDFRNVFRRKEYKPNTAMNHVMERVNKEHEEYKSKSSNVD